MEEGRIIFNSESGRYELGGKSLHCGTCLEVWDGEEWIKCRVEYNDNWDRGFYLIVFDEEGKRIGTIPLWDKEKGRL